LWDAVSAIEAGLRVSSHKKISRPESPDNVLRGFVICGICGSKIPRMHNKKVYADGRTWECYYFMCPLRHQHPGDRPFRSIRDDVLHDAVFPMVVERLQSSANLAAIIEKQAKRQSNPRQLLDKEISRVSGELETINQRLSRLYESYVEKLLSEAEYVGMKSEYERRADTLRQSIENLSRRVATMSDVSDNRWLKAVRAFKNPKELTREMVEAIIERVMPFENNRVEVVWKFKDEYELIESCASAGREGQNGNGTLLENLA
jgi:hypothetical protein